MLGVGASFPFAQLGRCWAELLLPLGEGEQAGSWEKVRAHRPRPW